MMIWSGLSRNLYIFLSFSLQLTTIMPRVYDSDSKLGYTYAFDKIEVCFCINSTIVDGRKSFSKASTNIKWWPWFSWMIFIDQIPPPKSVSWLVVFLSILLLLLIPIFHENKSQINKNKWKLQKMIKGICMKKPNKRPSLSIELGLGIVLSIFCFDILKKVATFGSIWVLGTIRQRFSILADVMAPTFSPCCQWSPKVHWHFSSSFENECFSRFTYQPFMHR